MEKQRVKLCRSLYVQLEGEGVQLLLLLHKMRAWIYCEAVFLRSHTGETR